MPPCASGPVFTVSRPSRNGSACATAGAGKRASVAAALATLPANTVRRLTLRVFGLAGIPRPPFFPILPAATNGRAPRQALLTLPIAALAAIIGEAGRAVKAAIVAFFSTLLQRRIVARIDRMSEEFLLRPGPELTDVFVSLDELIP